MALSRQQLDEFSTHLDWLEREHGVTLSAQDREDILAESVAGGFSPQATESAFDYFAGGEVEEEPDDFDEDDYDEEPPQRDFAEDLAGDVQDLQRDLNRRITGREAQGMFDSAAKQVMRHGRFDAVRALEDHYVATGEKPIDIRTSEGRSKYFKERLQDMEPEPEAPDRALDLTDREDRHEYLRARVRGVEFEDVE